MAGAFIWWTPSGIEASATVQPRLFNIYTNGVYIPHAGFADRRRNKGIYRGRKALAANPMAGDLMEGTGGARKVRWAARGKSKSGGVRTITYYAGEALPVFLLAIFGKGEKANLSQAERNALKLVLDDLAAEYRKGVRRHVKGR